MSVAMAATTAAAAVLTRRRVMATTGAGRGEHGKFLGQLF
jgi:hypothetical protein